MVLLSLQLLNLGFGLFKKKSLKPCRDPYLFLSNLYAQKGMAVEVKPGLSFIYFEPESQHYSVTMSYKVHELLL